ncbi:PEP-CTERM sorting domain-containing protein [Candidatus Poribacteria bacterium]|nr:PEP-CTERM sorting domain-containing protein [Candidatus Poribacteria bacterium]
MGTGTLTMNGSGSVIRDIDATQQRLVNAVGHTIQGRGQIGVGTMALTNQGTILANQSTSLTIDPNASGFTNEGTLRANAGSTLTVTDNLTNFSGTTLTGGTYEVFGTMRLPTGTNIVTNASTILLDGAGSQLLNGTSGTTNALANFATNAAAGDFTIQNGRNLTTPGAFSNAGIIMIDTGSMFTVDGAATNDYTQTAGMTTVNGTLTVPDRVDILGGSLFGNGTINGDVFNTVAINPGNSPGLLSIVGDYTQDPLGILNIELGGLLQGITYDFLNISLTAFLDGTLNVSLFGGFFPSVGDAFEILRSNSLSGTFTTINGLDLGGGFFLQPTYSATSLTLVAQQGSEPIPEPSTWLLLAVGLIGLVSYQYRRRLKVNRGS